MKKHKKPKFTDDSSLSRAHRELQTMKHKDLQRACIMRGLEPQKVVQLSDPDLANWFLKNHERGEDATLLSVFDAFVEGELIKLGHKKGDVMLSPSLRLGYIDNFENSETVSLKPKKHSNGDTEVLVKKSRGILNEKLGVYEGTKKALTYLCASEGKSIEETMKIVMDKFPEAVDKSIKIWYRKAINGKAKGD